MSADVSRGAVESDTLDEGLSLTAKPAKVFDRSSFRGNFLIRIPDQTPEDFELYAPDNQFCELIGGAIYMPPPFRDQDEDDNSPKVYNRSSFEGDFLIEIPEQTAEDFELYAPETQYCEFIDGTIHMPSPVSNNHQIVVGLVYQLLDAYRWARGTGRVYFGPAVLRMVENYKPEPDVFVCPAGDDSGEQAVLVVEVLSRGHEKYDLEYKDEHYRRAGVPEIWYIDQYKRKLIVRRKLRNSYKTEEFTEGAVHATEIPGFWIDVAWLWASPEANPRDCLEMILAGPPA
jgi:Uma2 family endonuclease